MKTTFSCIVAAAVIGSCTAFFAATSAYAQKDTVEFKFIPKYYPQDNPQVIPLPPPEIVSAPEIHYPDDPTLQGRIADVWAKVLVDRKGIVSRAEVIKSTDEAFNEYALAYAKQYRFRWTHGWPYELRNQKAVWISIPIHFRPFRFG